MMIIILKIKNKKNLLDCFIHSLYLFTMNIFGFGRKDIKTSIGTLKFNIPSSPLECQTTAILISPDLVLATASSVYSSSRQCFYTNVRFAT